MKVLLVSSGTRGDVQPVVALAQGLQNLGHEAIVCTNEPYRAFVEEHGVQFRGTKGNPEEVMNSKEVQEALAVGEFGKVFALTKDKTQEYVSAAFDDILEASKDVEAIVSTPMGLLASYTIAEYRMIPFVYLHLVPIAASSEVPHCLIPPEKAMSPEECLQSHLNMRKMSWAGWKEKYNKWRASLGLTELKNSMGHQGILDAARVPSVCAFSRYVLPRPHDWGPNVRMTGFLHLYNVDTALDKGLEDFLAAGEPPVFFSMGSMPSSDPMKSFDLAVDAAKEVGKRLVFAAGWSDIDAVMDKAKDLSDVIVVKKAPFSAVFPRCCSIVHHAGAGTTGTVAASGTPSVPVPVFMDQPFWANRLYKEGAAGKPVVFQSLNKEALVASLKEALAEPAVKAAAALGQRLKAEGNGRSAAAAAVLAFLEPTQRFVPSVAYNRTEEQIMSAYPWPRDPVFATRGGEKGEGKEDPQAIASTLNDDLPRITYFKGRGRAEVIRWALAASGIPFIHRSLEAHEDLKKLRESGDLAFGQLPLLEINGLKLVQAAAAYRYVGRIGHLYPEGTASAADMARIDMLCELAKDLAEPALLGPFRARSSEAMSQYCEEKLHPYLRKFGPYLEKLLQENSPHPFFVGNSPTLADVTVADALHLYEELLGRPALEEFPSLYATVQATMNLPGLAQYLSGNLRHPPSGPSYVAHVDEVLDRNQRLPAVWPFLAFTN